MSRFFLISVIFIGSVCLAACGSDDTDLENVQSQSPDIGYFVISGDVSGLSGVGLTLALNDEQYLPIDRAEAFSFPFAISDTSDYEVSVRTQPVNPEQTCSIAHGVGTVDGADVVDVEVTCATEVYRVGGWVSGIESEGLRIALNGGHDMDIAQNGRFTFGTRLADGATYHVSIDSLPKDPAHACVLEQASGRVAGSDVQSVAVRCAVTEGVASVKGPLPVTITTDAGTSTTDGVALRNHGDGVLTFEPFRSSSVAVESLLYAQTVSTVANAALAMYDLESPGTWAVQAADWIEVPEGMTWNLSRFVAHGFYGGASIPPDVSRFYVYEDDSGAPGAEIVAHEDLEPVDHEEGKMTIVLPDPPVLSAGIYWVSVQPEMHYTDDGRWFWNFIAGDFATEAHWRNPGNGYGTGCTDWGSMADCGFTRQRLSFEAFGTHEGCEDIEEISWLSMYPDAGLVSAGSTTQLEFRVDTAGLAAGHYEKRVCLVTNDEASPVLAFPVSLEVE